MQNNTYKRLNTNLTCWESILLIQFDTVQYSKQKTWMQWNQLEFTNTSQFVYSLWTSNIPVLGTEIAWRITILHNCVPVFPSECLYNWCHHGPAHILLQSLSSLCHRKSMVNYMVHNSGPHFIRGICPLLPLPLFCGLLTIPPYSSSSCMSRHLPLFNVCTGASSSVFRKYCTVMVFHLCPTPIRQQVWLVDISCRKLPFISKIQDSTEKQFINLADITSIPCH